MPPIVCPDSCGSRSVAESFWGAVFAFAFFLGGFVAFEVAFVEDDFAITFESENVRRQAVEEPAVVTGDHRTAAETFESFFECSQGIDVQVV